MTDCPTCKTLTRWSPEGLEPGKRPSPIRKQVYEPATHDDHECEYVICDDCSADVCECDSYRCEGCDAAMCNDCSIDTNDGNFCRYCCSSGYSYHAVEETAEKNYILTQLITKLADAHECCDPENCRFCIILDSSATADAILNPA